MWWLLFIYLCISKCSSDFIHREVHQISYSVAGIFEQEALVQRLAFNGSMRHAHLEDDLSNPMDGDGSRNDLQLEPVILNPTRSDSYSVWRELCSNKEITPIALFGPQNPISDGAIRDQCALANVPHIQATWKTLDPDVEESVSIQSESNPGEEESTDEVSFKKISINFFPATEEISTAYATLLKYYKWQSFAVLYEDDFGIGYVFK